MEDSKALFETYWGFLILVGLASSGPHPTHLVGIDGYGGQLRFLIDLGVVALNAPSWLFIDGLSLCDFSPG